METNRATEADWAAYRAWPAKRPQRKMRTPEEAERAAERTAELAAENHYGGFSD